MLAICGGLMRTGSIAMWQIMREIVISNEGRCPPLGAEFDRNVKRWVYDPKWVVGKLHRYRDSMDPYVNSGQIKVVMTIRDWRDVVVSLMNFRKADFESTLLSKAFFGNLAGYYEWQDNIPAEHLLIVKYEEFVPDRPTTIRQVADFLGIELEESEVITIAKEWDIPANVRRSGEYHDFKSPEYMSKRHIFSGAVNQWKTALTPQQVAQIEMRCWEWLEENGYELAEYGNES